MKVELTKEEIHRIWEYDRYIPHNNYSKIDREICLKFTKLAGN